MLLADVVGYLDQAVELFAARNLRLMLQIDALERELGVFVQVLHLPAYLFRHIVLSVHVN